MLMIFLMAILSLDLLHYSSQNRTSSSIESRASHGQYLMSNDIRGSNSTLHRISNNAVKSQHPKGGSSSTSSGKKPKKKILVRKRKASQNDTVALSSIPVKLSSKRPTPKSDVLMPFYAAQPMIPFDISYHQPIYENYNPLVNGILNMNEHPLQVQANPAQHQLPVLPIVEPIPFKQIDPQHFQPIPPPGMQKIPLLDPFNVLKPRKPARLAGKPKFLPVVRAIPQITTTLPPITVTHIYKYEETNSGLKMPFENDDFVDNFPAISVALDDHLHDRAADLARLKGLMTPPRLHQQPIYYNMPIVELSTLAPATFQNDELEILHKFNEAIKAQNNQLQQQQQQQQQQNTGQEDEQQFEYDEDSKETQDNKSYSDDDVKKALKYIQTLKKTRPTKPNRGSKKFDSERSQGKKRNKGKKETNEESFEEEEETERPRKNKHKSADFSGEDDNFTIMSFDELDGGESHNKVVKTKKKHTKSDSESTPKADSIDNIGFQESQIVPSLDHEDIQEYSPPPDFSENANLGAEGNEDRIEFQMHGLRGPESYKFGYDTGKGENRQFRYEERDPDGKVKGHFGYYDKDGKLQVFNYEADPEHGYHLEQANQNNNF